MSPPSRHAALDVGGLLHRQVGGFLPLLHRGGRRRGDQAEIGPGPAAPASLIRFQGIGATKPPRRPSRLTSSGSCAGAPNCLVIEDVLGPFITATEFYSLIAGSLRRGDANARLVVRRAPAQQPFLQAIEIEIDDRSGVAAGSPGRPAPCDRARRAPSGCRRG